MSLKPNYPNPFYGTTTIRFSLAEADYVRVMVYDVQGRLIKTVAERLYSAGSHEIVIDGAHLPAGVYLYQVETPTWQQTGRMGHVR